MRYDRYSGRHVEAVVKATADEAAVFREECLKWQAKFGLTDWTIAFKVEEAKQGVLDEADIYFDCDTRHATITYFTGVMDSLHPKDVACHEILHLLFADTLVAAIEARDEDDPLLAREEHKVIERLLKVLK
jgi:hypothetical protein